MKILVLIRKENSEYVNNCYFKAVEKYGGEVVKCYYNDHYEDILSKLSDVEGVLLTGGDDISLIGLFIINYCVRHDLRLLGICLGMQEMCVYSSDDKIISIGDLSHSVEEEGYVHDVNINKDSMLYKLFNKDTIKVNSHHKQTLLRSNYFNPVGYSDDGLLEAIEGKGSFQVGVQWHPERMLDYDDISNRLFEAFLNK